MLRSKKFSILSTFSIFLCLIVQPINGLRILGLFPIQLHSHFIMCQELMRGLAEKGHHVDVYSQFPAKTPIKNYHDYSLQDPNVLQVSNNLHYKSISIISKGTENLLYYSFERHQGPLCDLLGHPNIQKLLHDQPSDLRYDIIIVALSIVHCFIPFGKHLNVPVVGVITTPLMEWQYDSFGTPINLAVDRRFFSAGVRPSGFIDRLNNWINYYRVMKAYSSTVRKQDAYVDKYFGPGLPNSVDLLNEVSLVLVNHDLSLNGIMPFAPKVVPVGGLHIVDRNETLPKDVQTWLDDSKEGCIYFSFGSMARLETFPEHMIIALYKSFERIKPVRVLLKIAKPEEMPAGLPSNVLVRPWFQQTAVLKNKNVKAFVTHGGLMGTQEAVFYGVPMIIVPLFSDQFFNAETYVEKNIAVKIALSDIYSEESFTHAVHAILKNPLYRESIRRVSKLFRDHPLTPLDTAIYWVEYIHRHGKNVLKSPIEDMSWWQKSLLDVYAFVGGCIFVILFVCKKIVERLVFLCFRNAKNTTKLPKKID